jgi:hypothetical protein
MSENGFLSKEFLSACAQAHKDAGLRQWFHNALKEGEPMDAATDPGLSNVQQFVEVCAECGLNWLVTMRHEPDTKAWVYMKGSEPYCPHCGGEPKEALS